MAGGQSGESKLRGNACEQELLHKQLTDPRGLPHWTEENLRFGDQDPNGHLNNVAFCTLSEEGRLAFRSSVSGNRTSAGATGWVVAEISIRYLKSVGYPNKIEIGAGVLHVGRRSYVLGQGFFVKKSCVATAVTRSVWVGGKEQGALGPQGMPTLFREALTGWRLIGPPDGECHW